MQAPSTRLIFEHFAGEFLVILPIFLSNKTVAWKFIVLRLLLPMFRAYPTIRSPFAHFICSGRLAERRLGRPSENNCSGRTIS